MNRREALIFLAAAGIAQAAGQSAARPAAQPDDRRWQDGVLVSRRTLPAGEHRSSNRYLYRVRGGAAHYLVVLDRPLELETPAPVKFSVGRRHVVICDADGAERRAHLVQTVRFGPALR
jgi:hypothetical protein